MRLLFSHLHHESLLRVGFSQEKSRSLSLKVLTVSAVKAVGHHQLPDKLTVLQLGAVSKKSRFKNNKVANEVANEVANKVAQEVK